MVSERDLFNKARDAAARKGVRGTERESLEFFRKKMRELGRGKSANEILKSKGAFSNRPGGGNMYFFLYDPKLKDVLPYYDKFPLTIVFDRTPDGFRGINLHYLSPKMRVKVMGALLEITNNKKYDRTTKFKLTYQLLNSVSKLRIAKGAYKRYLFSHMKSRALKIDPEDWISAVFLPVARFEKASKTKVWSDTAQKGK